MGQLTARSSLFRHTRDDTNWTLLLDMCRISGVAFYRHHILWFDKQFHILVCVVCRPADQQHGSVESLSWQHSTEHTSTDSCSGSSDNSDYEEDSCSDIAGVRSSAVSVSCDNVRLQHTSSGTASTSSHPHRSTINDRCAAWHIHRSQHDSRLCLQCLGLAAT